jgi:acyl transferase domain-containing protein
MSACDLFRDSIADLVRGCYTVDWRRESEWGEARRVLATTYRIQVARLNLKDEFDACCRWLLLHGALDTDDLQRIAIIRRHRAAVANELLRMTSPSQSHVDPAVLVSLVEVKRKVDAWRATLDPVAAGLPMAAADAGRTGAGLATPPDTMVLTLLLAFFDGEESHVAERFASVARRLAASPDTTRSEDATDGA